MMDKVSNVMSEMGFYVQEAYISKCHITYKHFGKILQIIFYSLIKYIPKYIRLRCSPWPHQSISSLSDLHLFFFLPWFQSLSLVFVCIVAAK